MVDYSKQTVAQLRQLLKDRSIPSTGLQRKAQIIEKLEEADAANSAASEAPEASDESVDAPPSPVEQVEQEVGDDDTSAKPEAPGPVIAAAGESQAHSPGGTEPAPLPLPASTLDPLPETISHIDSDVPPPDPIKATERPAEDTTAEKEPGAVQPTEVFTAPPADSEEIIGPTVTEPADEEVEGDKKEELADDELPDAHGPAAEALRFAQSEPKAPKGHAYSAIEDNAQSPALTEELSVEKAELLPIPERSTAETSRLNTEEFEADSKKRKRRSATPELPSQDIRAKKHRPSHEPAPEVFLKEDEDVVMEQRRPEEVDSAEPDTKREKKEKIARYRDLIKPSAEDNPLDAITDDRPTVPALHPVTAALYIRNFMRPLRPEPLRAHLVSLATPPSSSPDSTIVKSLFLDAMKTHAMVSFTSTTAASRVRASLHGSIWPPEGNRKELWVDFIPDDHVDDWIKEEEDAIVAEKEARGTGRSMPPKRFEVVYPESSDGSIVAVFQEVGSNAPSNAPRGPRASIDVRRPSTQLHPTTSSTSAAPSKDARQDIEASFKTLDELFRSTAAKPQLFYLPVSDDISEARLKELDSETSRYWAPGETRKGRGIKTEMKYKYSFDDENRIVEVGEDRGPWSEGYRGGRGGGRGGYRGRGGGGGYRGRGGDGWRG
ncbi:SAP domain-containing protein [Pyrenochaeta sp. MPI-SDFR-AT-0127]|nr:SAP domain-containing protein [Pyrenochaeta sp. MPI-SDFR-AT-0127]